MHTLQAMDERLRSAVYCCQIETMHTEEIQLRPMDTLCIAAKLRPGTPHNLSSLKTKGCVLLPNCDQAHHPNRRHLTNFEKFSRIKEEKRPVEKGEFGGKSKDEKLSAPGADKISDEKQPVTVDEIAKESHGTWPCWVLLPD